MPLPKQGETLTLSREPLMKLVTQGPSQNFRHEQQSGGGGRGGGGGAFSQPTQLPNHQTPASQPRSFAGGEGANTRGKLDPATPPAKAKEFEKQLKLLRWHLRHAMLGLWATVLIDTGEKMAREKRVGIKFANGCICVKDITCDVRTFYIGGKQSITAELVPKLVGAQTKQERQ